MPSQDTGDTRETPAIDVCHGLIADDARLAIYDPQVKKEQIFRCADPSQKKNPPAETLLRLPASLRCSY